MTPAQLFFACRQINMVRAARANDHAAEHAHRQAASELRAKVGPVYQPYPRPNRALVKAAYNALQEDHDYGDFTGMLSVVRGEFRDEK